MAVKIYHGMAQHTKTILVIGVLLLKYSNCQSTSSNDILSTGNSIGNEDVTDEGYEIPKHESDTGLKSEEISHHSGIHLASWRWDEIGLFYTMTLFVVITGLSKVVFHYAHWLSSRVPESCSLIIVGIVVGAILHACGVTDDAQHSAIDFPTFTPRLFFLILLPPVILEAAYSLYNATFFNNISTILLYAVLGTIFNTFMIGALLYALGSLGLIGKLTFGEVEPVTDKNGEIVYILPLVECLVFSSLISAVDPVAVLAIFQEVGVNKDLYFLVFGESLLNDAITVVLYSTMVAFLNMPHIGGEQYTLAVLCFFTVNCGGMIIGIFYGLLTALLTKTTGAVRVVEPLAVLGIAYLSYLSAELFHFSGIISIICCGLVQAHYSFRNISQKSYVTVKYFTKMISSTSEAIIFLFLGKVLVSAPHEWHTGFVLWTLVLCLICRFIGVFALTLFANIFRVKRIGLQEQFIMAYGGLRGAVGFSLVFMLEDNLKARQVFVTTTLVVILFTVFVQGGTIKPLVKLLNIEISTQTEYSLIGEINSQATSHLMAGIEEIIGFKGNFYIKRKLQDIDEKYLQKIFYKSPCENKIKRVFEKWSLTQHYAHLYGPITLVEDSMTKILHEDYKEVAVKLTDEVEEKPPKTPTVEEGRSVRRRLSELFPNVELRKSSGDSGINKQALRKAFLSNPYNLYHHRYNRNLINDDAQEINSQLERRCRRTRQITRLAFEQSLLPSSSGQHDLEKSIPEGFSSTRNKIFSGYDEMKKVKQERECLLLPIGEEEEVVKVESLDNIGDGRFIAFTLKIQGAPIYEVEGMDNLLRRAQRRRTIQLGSADALHRIPQQDHIQRSQSTEERGSTSHTSAIKETEFDTIREKEKTPLLSPGSDNKSFSSIEEEESQV